MHLIRLLQESLHVVNAAVFDDIVIDNAPLVILVLIVLHVLFYDFKNGNICCGLEGRLR